MIVLDNNALVFLYRPEGGQEDHSIRMKHLFECQKEQGGIFGIPAPVLSEFLIGEPSPAKRQEFLQLFGAKSRIFKILPFDMKSAAVCAIISDRLKNLPNEESKEPRQKIKIDRQIIAIALSNSAQSVISHDKNLLNTAARLDLKAMSVEDIELPPEMQPGLF
ncbi:Uncharacterised protein [Kingella potus]|uniref:PIN domain-containing protein n=1 Tax=Kingella potus TaxID=265175 RepID=A0A377R658_9NEIS|nr:PIN domain-containing protein [Kingella potus]STQ99817.1 Uncharacterised protein [Kingella potus]STR03045.1 Uncharacterised protein [Kingella potus]STR03064.1 Uncharacterised protein [Kingella potus]